MRREDTIKNELKKLHKVYIALYCLDCMICNTAPISSAKVFTTRKAAQCYVHEMLGVCDPDNYIRELDFEF